MKAVRFLATKKQQRAAATAGTLIVPSEYQRDQQLPSLVRDDLEEHRRWMESLRVSEKMEPAFEADPSGVVERDLTEEVIDLKDMYDPRIHLATAPDWRKEGYEPSTPLTEELVAYIAVRAAPITVAEFMRQALTHPLHGYYTNPTRSEIDDDDDHLKDGNDDDDDDWDIDTDDGMENSTSKPSVNASPQDEPVTPDRLIFGSHGDFVTAPEVSQVFGESLAVWFVTQWQSMGKPESIQLVEVGPGRGTLMCDMLRFLFSFSVECAAAIREVHLIETSRPMRAQQKRSLEDLNVGASFYFDDELDKAVNDAKSGNDDKPTVRVKWHNNFLSMASSGSSLPSFVVCQEFIDALPVHAFQKTAAGWREWLVDVAVRSDIEIDKTDDDTDTDTTKVDTQKSPVLNEPTTVGLGTEASIPPASSASDDKSALKPRLRIILARDVSPATRTLLNVDENGASKDDAGGTQAQVGDVCEVCPEGILFVKDVADLLDRNSGAALIVDYGQEGTRESLRGFSRHKQVNFLSQPGKVDVTANVDFAALRCAVNAPVKAREDSDGNEKRPREHLAFGPVEQGAFLASMGVLERVSSLIEDDRTTEEEAQQLYDGLEMLVSPDKMGQCYKVLAISKPTSNGTPPPGFERRYSSGKD